MLAHEERRLIAPGRKVGAFELGLVTSAYPHFTRQHMEEGKSFWWVAEPKTASAVAIAAARKRPAGGEEILEAAEAAPAKKQESSWSRQCGGFGSDWPAARVKDGGKRRRLRGARVRSFSIVTHDEGLKWLLWKIFSMNILGVRAVIISNFESARPLL